MPRMPLVIKCSQCQKLLQVPDNVAGKAVRCPECKKVFVVSAAPAREPVGAGVATGAGAGERETQAAGDAQCPACKAPLLPGAIACMDCGYLVQGEPDAAQEAT